MSLVTSSWFLIPQLL